MKYGSFTHWTRMYELTFSSVIRGHHVYKDTWKPTTGEILYCREDHRVEAKQYDKNSVGVFREISKAWFPLEQKCIKTALRKCV